MDNWVTREFSDKNENLRKEADGKQKEGLVESLLATGNMSSMQSEMQIWAQEKSLDEMWMQPKESQGYNKYQRSFQRVRRG